MVHESNQQSQDVKMQQADPVPGAFHLRRQFRVLPRCDEGNVECDGRAAAALELDAGSQISSAWHCRI